MATGTAATSASGHPAAHAGADALESGASLLRRRHAGGLAGADDDDDGGGNAEEVVVASVEQAFADKPVPSWREQLTVRAFVVGALLSVVFNVILMKIDLTTGINPSLNVCASLLSYFLLRTWTRPGHRVHGLAQAALHAPGEHRHPDLRRRLLRPRVQR